MPDHRMKFFTPDLYMRYNSPNDEIADQADAEWDRAIREYQLYQSEQPYPEYARDLAKRCFHDGVLLYKSTLIHPTTSSTQILLQYGDKLALIHYRGGFAPSSTEPPEDWTFQAGPIHWLYDEVDRMASFPGYYIHRILWSDGRVFGIPFLHVSIDPINLHGRNPQSRIQDLDPPLSKHFIPR